MVVGNTNEGRGVSASLVLPDGEGVRPAF